MNLFSLYAKIGLDTSEYNKGINEVSKSSADAAKKIEEVGQKSDAAEKSVSNAGSSAKSAGGNFLTLDEILEGTSKTQKDLAKNTETVSQSTKSADSVIKKMGLSSSELANYNKSLKSELKQVDSEVLSLTTQYKKSVSESGRYSDATKELADKLEEAKKKQSDLRGEIESSSTSYKKYALNLSDIGSKISTVLVTGLKAAATAVGAAATGIGALSVAAINSYADYEQLKGGVETLFGAGGKSIEEYAESVGKSVSDVESEYNALMRSQRTVLNNADAAYENAGMSANEYMDTITSFSATLLQGLGNDTQKAAEYGDKAVVQMSDNANKMGTSMSAIQYAYQGFAKQNYTMLSYLAA